MFGKNTTSYCGKEAKKKRSQNCKKITDRHTDRGKLDQ